MCHTHFQVHLVSHFNMEIILINPKLDGSESENPVAEQTPREILNLSAWFRLTEQVGVSPHSQRGFFRALPVKFATACAARRGD